ncbi:hypothetical protein FACS189454_00830 [Planctomycetales bacterium]|nr:hypothetical protein FACS189454_00830 [Planctomycetales bacterium]
MQTTDNFQNQMTSYSEINIKNEILFPLHNQGNIFSLKRIKSITLGNFWKLNSWISWLTMPRIAVLESAKTNNHIIKVTFTLSKNGYYNFSFKTFDSQYHWVSESENWSGLPMGKIIDSSNKLVLAESIDVPYNEILRDRILYTNFFKVITNYCEYQFQEKKIISQLGFSTLRENELNVVDSHGTLILSTRLLSDEGDFIEIHSSPQEIDILLAIIIVYLCQAPVCHLVLIDKHKIVCPCPKVLSRLYLFTTFEMLLNCRCDIQIRGDLQKSRKRS